MMKDIQLVERSRNGSTVKNGILNASRGNFDGLNNDDKTVIVRTSPHVARALWRTWVGAWDWSVWWFACCSPSKNREQNHHWNHWRFLGSCRWAIPKPTSFGGSCAVPRRPEPLIFKEFQRRWRKRPVTEKSKFSQCGRRPLWQRSE